MIDEELALNVIAITDNLYSINEVASMIGYTNIEVMTIYHNMCKNYFTEVKPRKNMWKHSGKIYKIKKRNGQLYARVFRNFNELTDGGYSISKVLEAISTGEQYRGYSWNIKYKMTPEELKNYNVVEGYRVTHIKKELCPDCPECGVEMRKRAQSVTDRVILRQEHQPYGKLQYYWQCPKCKLESERCWELDLAKFRALDQFPPQKEVNDDVI